MKSSLERDEMLKRLYENNMIKDYNEALDHFRACKKFENYKDKLPYLERLKKAVMANPYNNVKDNTIRIAGSKATDIVCDIMEQLANNEPRNFSSAFEIGIQFAIFDSCQMSDDYKPIQDLCADLHEEMNDFVDDVKESTATAKDTDNEGIEIDVRLKAAVNVITVTTGTQKQEMIDLYRELVLSHLTDLIFRADQLSDELFYDPNKTNANEIRSKLGPIFSEALELAKKAYMLLPNSRFFGALFMCVVQAQQVAFRVSSAKMPGLDSEESQSTLREAVAEDPSINQLISYVKDMVKKYKFINEFAKAMGGITYENADFDKAKRLLDDFREVETQLRVFKPRYNFFLIKRCESWGERFHVALKDRNYPLCEKLLSNLEKHKDHFSELYQSCKEKYEAHREVHDAEAEKIAIDQDVAQTTATRIKIAVMEWCKDKILNGQKDSTANYDNYNKLSRLLEKMLYDDGVNSEFLNYYALVYYGEDETKAKEQDNPFFEALCKQVMNRFTLHEQSKTKVGFKKANNDDTRKGSRRKFKMPVGKVTTTTYSFSVKPDLPGTTVSDLINKYSAGVKDRAFELRASDSDTGSSNNNSTESPREIEKELDVDRWRNEKAREQAQKREVRGRRETLDLEPLHGGHRHVGGPLHEERGMPPSYEEATGQNPYEVPPQYGHEDHSGGTVVSTFNFG